MEAGDPGPEPADLKAIPWPMGDRKPDAPPSVNIDKAWLKPAVDELFVEADPKKKLCTRALLIIYDGRLIVERYGSGITQDTPLLSWSMAKSFTNALIGILVRKDKSHIRAPAPCRNGEATDDPRHAITVDQLCG